MNRRRIERKKRFFYVLSHVCQRHYLSVRCVQCFVHFCHVFHDIHFVTSFTSLFLIISLSFSSFSMILFTIFIRLLFLHETRRIFIRCTHSQTFFRNTNTHRASQRPSERYSFAYSVCLLCGTRKNCLCIIKANTNGERKKRERKTEKKRRTNPHSIEPAVQCVRVCTHIKR